MLLKYMSYLHDLQIHPMCKGLILTHLIFADALIIICIGKIKLITRIKEALAHFSAASGFVGNMDKSSLFLISMNDQVKQQQLNLTSFSNGSFPIRYLRLPFSFKKWNKTECCQLIKKITIRIKTIYTKQLSYARRF